MKSTDRIGIHFQDDDTCMSCAPAVIEGGSVAALATGGQLTYITVADLELGDSYCNQCGWDLADAAK